MGPQAAAGQVGDYLAASQEELVRLRLAVEASGEVVFMTDANGVMTYVNPEFVRLYGYDPAELVGKTTPRILKGGETSESEYRDFWKELRQRRLARREFRNRTKAGELVTVECSANPIVVDDELVGFLAVQRDITRKKAVLAALRESEARYRTLAEAAHDSIFIVDTDRRIEYANAVTLARFNITSDAAIGKVLDEVFAPGVVAEMWRELQEVFSSGERRYFEARFDAAAGDLWLGTWLVPMARDPGGKPAVMGLSRDITERKRLEREFAQAQKMEAIGRLAGGIAHDFNNLLTAILGYGEFVQERVRHDPTLTADVYEIRRAGERASRLTRQLLTFSRKQAFSPRVLDLNEVVTDLEKMLTRVIGEDILLEIVTDPALDHTKVDPSQIEQLIVNLVVNARDALPRGGIVRIHTRNVELGTAFARDHEGATPGRYVALVVEDNGCGMTPDVLSHVFEPFFTTKPEGKGTGLGLSTVYGIVKQSGGYITIDSTPGLGTTITSYFPVAEIATDAPAATSVTKPGTGSETILLVEDEPGLRRLMHRTLEQYGYRVLSSENVPEVLKMAERHDGPIDLLVTDIVMPGLAGPDLAQRIIRLRPSTKVLYVSGFSNRVVHAASGPRTCFLAKPFTPHVLATRVRECLDGRPIHGIGL